MIPKDCRRLIEVDFPIATVSKHSAREKSIRNGHPSTLHLWWARRPLAACRAVLIGLLLPDPCNPICPLEFKNKAKKVLESMLVYPKNDAELQSALLKFIGDFADWNNASDQTYLRVGRELVKAAHPEETPLVVDPFAGGGSIPLEALRLGCDTFASDLNPVACLILKVMLEDVPKYGPELVKELRTAGLEIGKRAEEALSEFYPTDPDGTKQIAYLWARTIRCETPGCGAEVPLVRSFWLANKADKKIALRLVEVDKARAKSDSLHCIWGETTTAFMFDIFSPKKDEEVAGATVQRGKATCPCCGRSMPPPRVRTLLSAQKGGTDVELDDDGNRRDGARLLAVVGLKDGKIGRCYRLPTDADYRAVFRAHARLTAMEKENQPNGLSVVPDERINPIRPSPNARGLSAIARYNMMHFRDIFSQRQLLSLATYLNIINKSEYSPIVKQGLTLALSKMTDLENGLCTWRASSQCVDHLFARQAIPFVWDFAEASPIAGATGSWDSMLERSADGALSSQTFGHAGQVQMADAARHPLPDDCASVWFTDPPYYDAVPYADLSDFFYIWIRRASCTTRMCETSSRTKDGLTPKTEECVWNKSYMVSGKPKDRLFFEDKMAKSAQEGLRILRDDGIGCVVFAHKTTEGWEALIGGLIEAKWVITASWPILTEMAERTNARNTASLMGSVHLVCRPRSENAPVGEWAEVLRELPIRVGDWMERLHKEGIRGADMVFACIGPALEIYSRHSRVETADGREIELPEYLGKVWEVVGRKALENVLGTAEARTRNGAAGTLEEDARLTALFLWTLQSNATKDEEMENDSGYCDDEEEEGAESAKGGYSLIFDVARRFSQPLGIDLPKWEGRIVKTEKGAVRLLSIHERAKQLFGEEGAQAVADRMEDLQRGPVQMKLFLEEGAKPPEIKRRGRGEKAKSDISDEALKARREATTLDKVHAAMLLQDSGRTNALRALVEAEQQRGPEFMRLANALSALYPPKSEEKRLLDAMILSAPR